MPLFYGMTVEAYVLQDTISIRVSQEESILKVNVVKVSRRLFPSILRSKFEGNDSSRREYGRQDAIYKGISLKHSALLNKAYNHKTENSIQVVVDNVRVVWDQHRLL